MEKILTLGPSSQDTAIITRLLKTATSFRLNSSHINNKQLLTWLINLEKLFKKSKTSIPVIIDLQGAKMRIGKYPNMKSIPTRINLVLDSDSSNPELIPLVHEELFKQVKPCEILLLNDAKIQIEIKEVNRKLIKANVIKNGPLSSFKGINRALHPVPYINVLNNDLEAINTSIPFEFVHYALSFVHNGSESELIRPLIKNRRLIAKIERKEAFKHLIEIDKKFDQFWLCRGDLGAQAGLSKLGSLQEEFVNYFPRQAVTECFNTKL